MACPSSRIFNFPDGLFEFFGNGFIGDGSLKIATLQKTDASALGAHITAKIALDTFSQFLHNPLRSNRVKRSYSVTTYFDEAFATYTFGF